MVLNANQILQNMDYYVRKIIRGSKERGNYSVNIPISIVRELEFHDCKVTIKVKGRELRISKVGEKTDDVIYDEDILI